MSYQITVDDGEGLDIVEFTCPLAACQVINDSRAAGLRVTYTGDPFAAVDAMLAAELEAN